MNESQWKPITEPPEVGETVLVIRDGRYSLAYRLTETRWCVGGTSGSIVDRQIHKYTHWHPLPPPPTP